MTSFFYTMIISPIELLIEFSFVFFYKFLRNFGLSVVAISMVVSFLTLPLYQIAESIQKKEREQRQNLQSKINRVKKAFKGDEQYMMLATLYRQNNYHPLYALRSSFSLLIQIPFFIAAYHFLSHLTILEGISFFYIADLSSPDQLMRIGSVRVNVLPLLMTTINILTAMIYSHKFPFRDKIQLFGMAGLFLVLLYSSPSALVLYWTFNNLFSLAKNVVYKSKNPKKFLYLIGMIGAWGLIAVIFISKPRMNLIKRVILVSAATIITGLPVFLRIGTRFYNRILDGFQSTIKSPNTLFFLSVSLLCVLLGITIPSKTIASSPIEFSHIGMVDNPFHYIVYNTILFFGLTVLWPALIYFISPKKTKILIMFVAAVLALSVLLNIFVFKGAYSNINNVFLFEILETLEPSRNLAVIPLLTFIVLIVAIGILIQLNHSKHIVALVSILLASSVLNAAVTINQISKEYELYMQNLDENQVATYGENQDIEPLFSLSRKNENVVVIFLDRAISSYFSLVFEEFPELYDIYSGFDFYPNTLSFGWNTLSGAPPLMGGYEYTPEEFNKRKNEKLVDKHNEASLVLPLIFSQAGYRAFVFNPPLANYRWAVDFTAFRQYPEIDVFATKGTFSKKYQIDNLDAGKFDSEFGHLIIKKRLPLYSLFQALPPLFRPLLYDKGTYFQIHSSQIPMTHDFLAFIDDYAELFYLPELTEIDEGPGSYIFFANDTPHRPFYLQAPDYTPVSEPTDISNPLQSDRLSKDAEQTHYHANAATILQIGKWIQYLKENGVYNNTRIIMASDHGHLLYLNEFRHFPKNGIDYARYNPLLAVKDFDANHSMTTVHDFMTNADVPLLALDHIVDDPINPFTNNRMREFVDKEYVNLYNISGHPGDNQGNLYQFKSEYNYIVKDNIFVVDNWIENLMP